MRPMTLTIIAAAAGLFGAMQPLGAAPSMPAGGIATSSPLLVAEGCGPGRWRGAWGGCRGPGWGPGPGIYDGGYYGVPASEGWYGCPPGFWRGPWGHCRDTPYHGRLPGGGWR